MKERIEELATVIAYQHCDAGADQNAIESVITTAVNEALELAAKNLDDNWYRTQSDCAAAIKEMKLP